MAEERGANAALSDQSVADLLRTLSEQTARLVSKELELAKAELTVKGKRAGIGAGMFGAAGVLGFYAFGALTACLILALGHAVTGWLAALIVAVLYGAGAGVMAMRGKSNVQAGVPPVPEQATQSTKEDIEWTKQRAREGRS
jgi:hypothetical protein